MAANMDDWYPDKKWATIDKVCLLIMLPWQLSLQKLLSSFKSTSKEIADRFEDPCYERYVILTFLLPILVIFLILYLPVYTISLLIWMVVQRKRTNKFKLISQKGTEKQGNQKFDHIEGYTFSIAAINACLLSESRSRDLNLANCQSRAIQIANSLNECVSNYNETEQSLSDSDPRAAYPSSKKQTWKETTADEVRFMVDDDKTCDLYGAESSTIITSFPANLGVVVFSHVTDWRAEDKLISLNEETFPHTISRVGTNSWESNRFCSTSGIVILSRLPILCASFFDFPSSEKYDHFRSEGLLVLAVTSENMDTTLCIAVSTIVSSVSSSLSSHVFSCLEIFESNLKKHHTEFTVLGEVLCLSSFDRETISIEKLVGASNPKFERSTCNAVNDHAHGTNIKLGKLYKKYMSDPSSLKRSLDDPSDRKQLLEWDDEKASESTVILHRPQSATHNMTVKEMVTTRLATLVNTLPICHTCDFEPRL